MSRQRRHISAIDLFCGAGGLSYGLQQAGVLVVGGIDIDSSCRYPFETNIEGPFIEEDIRDVTADHLTPLWADAEVRLLAGCAPCQPFSPYRRGVDTSTERSWPLLGEFGRLVEATLPDLITMENVPRIRRARVFVDFVAALERLGYHVDTRSCDCLRFGLAQTRRRLVLIASRLGPVTVPTGDLPAANFRTVRQVIRELPSLAAGETDGRDALHRSRALSDVNLRRVRASTPGGTWQEWPEELRAPCHRKSTGSTFRNVYARMEWDKPAPTITTLAHNFGTGRFGHPDQDRGITLREAAMLQGFPREYWFVGPGQAVRFSRLGRLIGNAVPPPLGRAVGAALVKHVAESGALL